jgi:hypothetical protein
MVVFPHQISAVKEIIFMKQTGRVGDLPVN